MATKTLILRPIASDSHTAAYTYIPSDVTDEEAYLLVNEEIADNDITYINISDDAALAWAFQFSVPIEQLQNIQPTAIRVTACLKAVTSTEVSLVFTILTDNPASADTDLTLTVGQGEIFPSTLNTYEIKSCNLLDGITDSTSTYTLEQAYAGLLEQNGTFYMSTANYVEGSNKNSEANYIHLTQIYLEIDYEAEIEQEPLLYVKQDNTWQSVYGEAYKKVNNQWIPTTLDFNQNLNAIIKIL